MVTPIVHVNESLVVVSLYGIYSISLISRTLPWSSIVIDRACALLPFHVPCVCLWGSHIPTAQLKANGATKHLQQLSFWVLFLDTPTNQWTGAAKQMLGLLIHSAAERLSLSQYSLPATSFRDPSTLTQHASLNLHPLWGCAAH